MVSRRRDKKPANVAGERVRFILFDIRVSILPMSVSSENAAMMSVGGAGGGWIA